MHRRWLLKSSLLAAAAVSFANPLSAMQQKPRFRVIVDNDFSGDPDGLFQLAHHLLSPSLETPMVIGSHIHVNDFIDGSETQADNAVRRVRDLYAAMDFRKEPQVFTGRYVAGNARTELTDGIIAEAKRTDTDIPLFYACGAGLTELAAALRAAPEIGSKMRLVWIGGPEWYEVPLALPSRGNWEYNFHINSEAAQFVFNESSIEIWQIPRQVYRQMIISMAGLRWRLQDAGKLGTFLLDALDQLRTRWGDQMGETFILGDNPLVTLTALLSSFEPDTASSAYQIKPTPRLGESGRYVGRPDARPMRVYTEIDTRLTFADMFAKFSA